MNKIEIEQRKEYLKELYSNGCKFWKLCTSCPYPLENDKCLRDWTIKKRQKYFQDPKNVLDIKFGSAVGKKPYRSKFALIRCYLCGAKGWVHYPYRLGGHCLKCNSGERKCIIKTHMR